MRLNREQEYKLCQSLLKGAGMYEEDAAVLSAVVTHSDFTGIYSHGLSRFSNYIKHINNGVLNPKANMKYVQDTGSTVVMDADNGSGVVAVNKMYEDLLPRAKQYGIVMGTALHSSNIGCGSYYARRAAKDGVIAIVVANTACCMAPFGGADKIMGTNPIIVGVPTGEEYPVIVDMATSNVAMGKVQAAAREGAQIPLGWGLTKEGKPTTDAREVYSLVPMGQHKGYCLAVIVDILSSLLSRAAYTFDIGWPHSKEKENTGFAVILIDVDKFIPIDEFRATMDAYIRSMKGSRPAEGSRGILMPGEYEFAVESKIEAEGIEVSEALGKELAGFAAVEGIIPEGTSFEDYIAFLEK